MIIQPKNILPYDGTVLYYGRVLPDKEADHYFARLLENAAWKHDEAVIYGKKIITKRKVAWYGDKAYQYTYSNVDKYALPWLSELLTLKGVVQHHSYETYNSCLLNLYHHGEEGMSWHSDGETDLKKNGAIASLTLGATRKFCFKHKKSKEKVEIYLRHGDLLVMTGTTQTYWLHALPPTKKTHNARINMTFRTIVSE